MKEPLISIIIRTKNEEKYLSRVLAALKQQTFHDFEIIIVDNESTDRTLEIARNFGCKIITIKKGEFTYPHACNVGAGNSVGKYIVFMSGHSLPIHDDWLSDGLKNYDDEKTAGVYGTPFALPDANLSERMIYAFWGRFFQNKRFVVDKPEQVNMGVLGFTNAMIRRDLWDRYNINEAFAGGGEDGDWAKQWIGWKNMSKVKEFAPQKKNV